MGINNGIYIEDSSPPPKFPSEDIKVTDMTFDTTPSPLKKIQDIAQKIPNLMGNVYTVDNFFSDANRWKTKYPYRFIIFELDQDGKPHFQAAFRLPINPQDISITIPFAIKTTVTSGGILEEHNGIPLKQITINGTTGININRESNEFSNANTSVVGTIASGTISAGRDFVSAINRSKNEFSSANVPSSQSKIKDTPTPSGIVQTSGYYQYHMMRMFLEAYATLKKSPNGRGYRLAFEMTRDNEVYFVTPNNFTTRKSASSPMEYSYTMTMTAWADLKRISALAKEKSGLEKIDKIGRTRKFLNALKNLRKVATAAKNVISSVKADIEANVFGPINDMINLCKDIVSVAMTVADLAKGLRDSFQATVVANFESLVQDIDKLKDVFSKVENITGENSSSNSAQPYKDSKISGKQDYYNSEVFDDLDITDAIPLTRLPISTAQQQAIDAAVEAAQRITDNDVLNLVGQLNSISVALESSIASRPATDDEWDILYAIHDSITEAYAFIADGGFRVSELDKNNAKTNQSIASNALDYWEKNTANFEIPFNRYSNKFSVPFPFKGSLEELAKLYLGSATLWPDIAAINGLQAPYVDEDGFSYPFLSNGSANIFNVSNKTNLYVGQTIYITSSAESMTKRRILAINEISSENFQIVVDGDANMGNYKFSESASMKAYLPNTVNSMKKIYIPTNELTSSEEVNTKPITFIDEDIEFVKFSKIDLLLDSSFDLAITSDGFANLAYGTTNLLQAAKLKLATAIGSKLLDPSYGAGVEPGESLADIDVDQIIANINSSFSSDPRYNAPSNIDFLIENNTILMTIFTSVKQGNGIMPITIPLTE